MTFDNNCIFCKISQKQAPSSILYEDKTTIAFLDIIPKNHYVDIFDTPEQNFCQTHVAAKKISPAIKKATKADGISIIQQNGKAAGQDIFHIHVHIIPRFYGQKLKSFSELTEIDRQTLDALSQKIRSYL